MANHTYSKGLLYKKTLNSSGEVTGSVPLLLKTLGSLVIMSDGSDAETAINTAIANMVTPDETTIVTGQDGITISVKKSTSAEIDEILGDVPSSHTWEGYYTKSEVNSLVGAVDAKFNQTDIETALGYTPIASSTKGSANGVASLDANGLVPSAQLPSYVDDVIESATFAALPATGETGKIYVTLNDNKTYRWSGSAYVEISASLALGETSSTAFAGDKGKTAYDHVSDTTKHVPTGGSSGQYLKNNGNNTYSWVSPDSSWPANPTNTTQPGTKLIDDRFKENETNIDNLLKKSVKVYTYHVNPNESDPEDAITYLDDAVGMTPAKMGASTFSYGSWANAWFLPRPCMLKSDGTVAYYLDPNDYSKKTDGTASDITNASYDGNVMIEFPKIWVKRTPGATGERTVSIAPVNVDGTYKCWSNINSDNQEVDHFYLPAYNGTVHSSKLRSLSGVTLNSTYAPNKTRAEEVTLATANNPSGKNMWYTETWADFCLIFDLLYLMGKSLNLQSTFGNGLATGSETAMRAYVTGSLDDKGLFYGDISAQTSGVKVLGMENVWGCRWHAVAGLINDNGTLKAKMTYGVADGSTAVGYNTTGNGYLSFGSTFGTSGYVTKMEADNKLGYKIIATSGSDSTYYCDYYYTNNSQLNYALLGGGAARGLGCGFCVGVSYAPAAADWDVGAALSCRP